jgi:hypothetical protein
MPIVSVDFLMDLDIRIPIYVSVHSTRGKHKDIHEFICPSTTGVPMASNTHDTTYHIILSLKTFKINRRHVQIGFRPYVLCMET